MKKKSKKDLLITKKQLMALTNTPFIQAYHKHESALIERNNTLKQFQEKNVELSCKLPLSIILEALAYIPEDNLGFLGGYMWSSNSLGYSLTQSQTDRFSYNFSPLLSALMCSINFKELSYEVKKSFIWANPYSIKFFKEEDITDDLKELALSLELGSARFIEKLPYKLQKFILESRRNDRDAFYLIKSPCKRIFLKITREFIKDASSAKKLYGADCLSTYFNMEDIFKPYSDYESFASYILNHCKVYENTEEFSKIQEIYDQIQAEKAADELKKEVNRTF